MSLAIHLYCLIYIYSKFISLELKSKIFPTSMNEGNNDIVGDEDLLWCIYVQHFPINPHHCHTLTHRGFKMFALGLTILAPCSFYECSGKQSNLGKPSREKITFCLIKSPNCLDPSPLFLFFFYCIFGILWGTFF